MNTGAPIISAHDVAREIGRRSPFAGRAKVHKLLYYCQGWHLTWAGEPLFGEPIQAWTNGPVVASLWADEKHDRPLPTPTTLEGDALATVDYVLTRYGGFSGKELIQRTHLEPPWQEASEDEDDPSPEITHEALLAWFEQDDERTAYVSEVRRLRGRMEASAFNPLEMSADLGASIERALRGERIVESRPV